MGAKPNTDTGTYEEQLSDLERRLKGHDHDEGMLGDVGLAIRNLLARNGGSEAHIRQILERQFDQGNLRRETYELVEKLLGKIVAEGGLKKAEPPDVETPYVETAVLDQPGHEKTPERVTEQLQIGSVLRDRYLLKEQVAEGSMGTVYKALDRRLAETGEANPFVAIKVLSPKLSRNGTALRALQQEAAKGRYLSHPNIVRFIDLDREEDLFFIVMEWLPGRSLARILDDNRGSALDFRTAMNIVRQTARALSYAHQRGVVHADIKPGNIIITPEGQVKLIDFGVARVRQKENEGKSRFDPSVMRAGSPAYSSMQVLTGEDPVPSDDVFSLACLMYRLIAGYRVFGPRNAADAAQEGMEPQKAPGLSDEQWQILKKALSYPRVTRFDSPKTFMDAFAAAPAGGSTGAATAAVQAPQIAAPDRPVPKPRARPASKTASAQAGGAGMSVRPETFEIGSDETTQIAVDTPMRAERDPIMFEPDDERPSRFPWRLLVVGVIMVAATTVILRPQLLEELGLDERLDSLTGLVDDLAQQASVRSGTEQGAAETRVDEEFEQLDALPEVEVAQTVADDGAGNVVEELVIDAAAGAVDEVAQPEPAPGETAAIDMAAADPVALPENEPDPLPPPVDFSALPEPAAIVELKDGERNSNAAITAREDGGSVYIDVIRDGDLGEKREVRFAELMTDRRAAAAASPRYELENGGVLVFERGQPRARMTLVIPSNQEREADAAITLGIFDGTAAEPAIAAVSLTVEDDDQRTFEAGLPVNTIGFTAPRVTVREFDPAVQVDIVRYRPDSTAIEIPFRLIDVSATEGQDYFGPGLPVVYFGPGQRTARVLIPLGQDARPEQDELFTIELDAAAPPANSGIYARISVTITDDDL
jgi:serine/threonine protein kinase